MADSDPDEREEELGSLAAIFPELITDAQNPFAATLQLPVEPTDPLWARFVPAESEFSRTCDDSTNDGSIHIDPGLAFCYLPPLTIKINLPDQYPTDAPPEIRLSTELDWVPKDKLSELEKLAVSLWEEYGRCQILYSYVDAIQQAAEAGFDLDSSSTGGLVLPSTQEAALVEFNSRTKQEKFDSGTYDCGICLDPKKGTSCYRMARCGHVFCRQCLQDCYNNAIKEGDVGSVRCLDPTCGKEDPGLRGRKQKTHSLRVHELLTMGLEESVVRRYVEMKRKKKLEVDKNTVYCPRSWCQGPARSSKYPPIPADLTTYVCEDSSDEYGEQDQEPANLQAAKPSAGQRIPPDPADRLAVCEKCSLAFCKVCYMGWHGPVARCYPRDPNELSAEEKASYDYIRKHTSPCAYCNAPVQKTMGCNHMQCFQCKTHFCYLCSAWLPPDQPYQHFNRPGTECYQRLWELEEGDNGQAPAGGFGGGRGWEQAAIEAAQQAEAEEAEEGQRGHAPAGGVGGAVGWEQDVILIIPEDVDNVDQIPDDWNLVAAGVNGAAIGRHAPNPPPQNRHGLPAVQEVHARPVRRQDGPNARRNNGAQRERDDEWDRQQAELEGRIEQARRRV